MKNKFKLGDRFTKKCTRDTIPLEIYEITYNAIEPIYKLKPIRLCGDDIILGEDALTELYIYNTSEGIALDRMQIVDDNDKQYMLKVTEENNPYKD